MENERIDEINSVINMIQSICEKSKISLVPYKRKNGEYVIGVHDNIIDKTYIVALDK